MRRKIVFLFNFILATHLLLFGAGLTEANEWSEVAALRAEFEKMIGTKTILEENYLRIVLEDAVGKILSVRENGQSQYFVYVDRNPKKQIILVYFFDALRRNIIVIGADKISTGNQNRRSHFITPVGIFANTIKNIGYRALGTKNDAGWRGLGAKGSRVWDFGWQRTPKNNREIDIRLLLHATDPDLGEPSLGKIDSKGCVRVSGKLNKFLDHFGLLDQEYETNKDRRSIAWLLKSDREPAAFAGKYMLVGDSSVN